MNKGDYFVTLLVMNKLILLIVWLFWVIFFTDFSYSANVKDEIRADKELAELGNAGALFRLGARYLNGADVPKNYNLAYEYLSRSADLGHANALYNVGFMHLYGVGREVDYTTAKGYFERAKAMEFMPAYHVIGVMLEDGAGYKRDLTKAKKYYQKAADTGYEPSIRRLKELEENQK